MSILKVARITAVHRKRELESGTGRKLTLKDALQFCDLQTQIRTPVLALLKDAAQSIDDIGDFNTTLALNRSRVILRVADYPPSELHFKRGSQYWKFIQLLIETPN